METTIDRAGRVVIPKALRDSAGLKPGMKLDVRCEDGRIEIEPVRQALKWVKRGGLIVAVAPKGTPKLTGAIVNRLIAEDREERFRKILYGRP
jgi:AbrB family looped-hinge helix DNA binding protein